MKRVSVSDCLLLAVLLASLILGACAPAAAPAPAQSAPTQSVAAQPPTTQPPAPTAAPTQPPAPTTAPSPTPWAVKQGTLRLATTTSTADTGLLAWLLPDFEKANNVKVDVVAVGTGQAIAIGQRGDADVLLVHARSQEDQFVKDGHAKERFDVMYNDFIVVGPKVDPAKVTGAKDSAAAFKAIAETKAPFVSRGDKSGTNTKELSIWSSAKITPTKEMPWYNAIGQGMGDTLLFTNEKKGYTLTDRGTWLAMQSKLPDLAILFGGQSLAENKDKNLLNPYGIMAVNPDKHPGVQYDLAMKFVQWFTAPDTMKKIGSFGVDKFGQPLFYPDSDEYKATRLIDVKIGDKSQPLSQADLQALPKTTVADYEAVGVKKGPLGKNTWAGASLEDVLLRVDPKIGDASNAGKLIVLTSSDGWQAAIKWAELFRQPSGGEVLYEVKGCNECHGLNAEGTAPKGKQPAPALAGKDWPLAATQTILRTGKDAHGGLNPYTEAQLSDGDLQQILAWFKDPKATGEYQVAPAKQVAVLAYEKNGRPMTGKDGILQLIVPMDEFAGRYSHWVKSVEVK